jgi:DNA-binding transcriptional LysR family regulator
VYSPRNLELIRALAEHRNFGRAASALGVSQPSLTRSLKQIEARLGVTLFDRAGVTPTIFGEIALKHGRFVLSGFADFQREIAMTRGLEIGELSVSMAFYPAHVSGQEAAALLSKNHPNLSMDLRMLDWPRAKEAVLSGTADLAFADIRAAATETEFETERVRSGSVSLFCSSNHPLSNRKGADLEAALQFPWAGPSFVPSRGGMMPKTELACGFFEKTTGLFRPRILVDTFDAAKGVVLSSHALSAAFPFQITAEVRSGQLVILPVNASFLTLDYGFILKRGRARSPAANAFMDLVRTVERRRSSERGSR